jgi:hypothetical protein
MKAWLRDGMASFAAEAEARTPIREFGCGEKYAPGVDAGNVRL